MSENSEKKFDNDLINDSLDFCADIHKYYEAEEINRLDFNGYINRKNNRKENSKENSKEKIETVPSDVSKQEEDTGLKLYTKLLAIILFAMLFARFINAYIIQETIVNGSSMNPTLENSDKLLIDKFAFKIGKLNRYDIVVFHHTDTSLYIKRIIGLPGERVTIRKGRVYINGRILDDDPLIKDNMHYAGIAKNGVKVGKNEYFVLGDNRNNSYDSRYEQVGVIKKSSIIGKVWIRIFPFLKFGGIN